MLRLIYSFLIFNTQLIFADIFTSSIDKIKTSKQLNYSKISKRKKFVAKSAYLIAIFIFTAFAFYCIHSIINIFWNESRECDKGDGALNAQKNNKFLAYGISNNGSICYANSAMQMIFNNQYMVNYVESINDENMQNIKAQYENYTKQLYEILGLMQIEGEVESKISVDEIFLKLKIDINELCKKLNNYLEEYAFLKHGNTFELIKLKIKELETNLHELLKEIEGINKEFEINKYDERLRNYTKFISKTESGSFKDLLSELSKNDLKIPAYLINEDKLFILSLFASALGRIGIKFNKNNRIECLNKISSSLLPIGDDIEQGGSNGLVKIRDASEERKKLTKLNESNAIISLMYEKKMNYSDYETVIKNLKKFIKETNVVKRGEYVINILKAMQYNVNKQDDSSSFSTRLLSLVFACKKTTSTLQIHYTCKKCQTKYHVEEKQKQSLLFITDIKKPCDSMICESCENTCFNNIFNLLNIDSEHSLAIEFASITNIVFYENSKFNSIKDNIFNKLNLNQKKDFIEYAETSFIKFKNKENDQNNFRNLQSCDAGYLERLFDKNNNYRAFYYLCFFLGDQNISRYFSGEENQTIKLLKDNLFINFLNPSNDKNRAALKIDSDLPFVPMLIEYRNTQNLNILNFKNESGVDDFAFELQGVSARIGSELTHGHYIAYFQIKNKWFCANDTSIRESDNRGFKSPLFTYKNNWLPMQNNDFTKVQAAFYIAKNSNYNSSALKKIKI